MANKPPTPTYRRTFHVVHHASNERYRERFDGTPLGHLDEVHLANKIDEATVIARKLGRGIEIIDNEDNVPGEVVPLGEDKKLWALIKPNTNQRLSKKYPFAIVTVLRHGQVMRSLNGGRDGSPPRWTRKGEKPKNRSQSFTLPPEQLAKLEALKAHVADKEPTTNTVPIKLEFKNGAGSVYRDCNTIKEAEELINKPPEGLSYVRAWIPAPTEEVKRTKLKLT